MTKSKINPLDWGKVTSCTTTMDGYRGMTVVIQIPVSNDEEMEILKEAFVDESISSVKKINLDIFA